MQSKAPRHGLDNDSYVLKLLEPAGALAAGPMALE